MDGFMTQKDYRHVCKDFRMSNGSLFPIPIYFDVTEAQAKEIEKVGIVEIKDFNNRTKGYLHVSDV